MECFLKCISWCTVQRCIKYINDSIKFLNVSVSVNFASGVYFQTVKTVTVYIDVKPQGENGKERVFKHAPLCSLGY